MVYKTSWQVELGVPASAVWKVFAEDLVDKFPRLLPNIFASIELLEGDGGVGTLLLFKFGEGGADDHEGITYQKDKVVEKDEGKHIIAFEVIEGGYRQMGFSYFKSRFEMNDKGESSCDIDCSMEYETISGEPTTILTIDLVKTLFKAIEIHILSPAS